MRKLFAFGLVLFLFIHFSAGESAYANGKTYEVGVDSLIVRDQASSDGSVVGSLSRGDQLTVFKEKNGWAMTYFGDQEAWVASHFLVASSGSSSKSPTAKKQLNQTVTVTENGVRLRSGSDLSYKIVGFRNKGDQLQVVDSQNDWYQVKLSDGNKAWIASWLTSDGGSKSTQASGASGNKSVASPSAISLQGKNIVLDAGHGGYDPGSTALNNMFEKDLTSEMTQTIGSVLESYGATVIYTRSGDQYVSLFDRVRLSNAYWTDAFVSIHFNAFPDKSVNGISSHYYGGNDNYELAAAIQNELTKHTDLNDRGVQPDNYYVLRENTDTSVLLELGFLTNKNDLNNIMSNEYRGQVGEAVANGLAKYFK